VLHLTKSKNMEVFFKELKTIKSKYKLNTGIIRLPFEGGLIAEIWPPSGCCIPFSIREVHQVQGNISESGADYLKGWGFSEMQIKEFMDKLNRRVYFHGLYDENFENLLNEWEAFRESLGFAVHICWNVLCCSITGYSNGTDVFLHCHKFSNFYKDEIPFQFSLRYSSDEALSDDFDEVIRKDILSVVLDKQKEFQKFLT
jgi:hypothetical protein